MYRIFELTLHKDMMALFSFLKNNPSRALRKDGYYKLLYYEPLDEYFTPFIYKLIALKIVETDPTEELFNNGWQFVRNLDIKIAGTQLITELRELELDKIRKNRQASGLELTGWVFDTITIGIFTKRDAALFVRLMYLNGYDFEQTVQLFSSIIKNTSLSRYFLELATKLYKEV
ncbi:TPA: hypothetical protein TXI81_001964 [Streptococcus suis]|nr:hypothetical protein [Streptococcus suis]